MLFILTGFRDTDLFLQQSNKWVGEGNGNSLQCSCLENPRDGGVYGVTQSQTQLSDFTFTFTLHFHALEKEMATHSSVLAWRIPGTGESMGLHRVGHDWSDLAAAAAWNSLDCFMLLFSLLVSSSLSFAWGHQISHFILMIIVIFLGANTHPPHGPPSLFLPPYRKLLLGLNVCTFFNTSTKFTKNYAGYGSYHLQIRKN